MVLNFFSGPAICSSQITKQGFFFYSFETQPNFDIQLPERSSSNAIPVKIYIYRKSSSEVKILIKNTPYDNFENFLWAIMSSCGLTYQNCTLIIICFSIYVLFTRKCTSREDKQITKPSFISYRRNYVFMVFGK